MNTSNTNLLLIEEIKNIAKSKAIDQEIVKNFLIDAIIKTYNRCTYEDNLRVQINLNNAEISIKKYYIVVEDDFVDYDENIHIPISDELVKNANLKLGDELEIDFDITKEFNQSQVSQIMQMFKQKITEISNKKVYESWSPMIGEVIIAEIEKEDKKGGFYTINLEKQYDTQGKLLEPTLGFLGSKELNPNEVLDVRKKYTFAVINVKEQSKFCPIILSRNSEKLVEYYMAMNIPEIDDGTIKIVKIARNPGIKSKVIVDSKTLPVTPASVCVGVNGERVKNISNQLNGEKIEIYNWNNDPVVLLSYIISKTGILEIGVDEENKQAVVVVDKNELSKIIGKKGSNVKLASIISGYAIDVISVEDKDEYPEIYFININSDEFKNKINSGSKPQYNRNKNESTIDENEIDNYEEYEDLDFTNSNDFEAFEEEVKQILNQDNEKNKF